MRARHRPHEQDDRHHHQPRRYHRGGQTDLALGVQDATARGDKHQHERAKEFREQPAVREARIIELISRSELEHPKMPRTPRVVRRKGRALVVGTAGHTTSVSLRPVSSARLSFGRAHTPLRSTPPGLDGVFPACFVLLLMLLFDEARRVRSARIAAAGATGPAILGNRPLPSAAIGVIAPLARALLAGLVISDILGPNWSSADG